MSDIKDILGISRDASAAPRPRPTKQIMKKPVGMSREVFALLNQDVKEGNAPLTLAPSAGQPDALLKEKRTRMVGWEWKEFHNSGRTDGLRLRHWGKNNDKSTEYAAARHGESNPDPWWLMCHQEGPASSSWTVVVAQTGLLGDDALVAMMPRKSGQLDLRARGTR